MLEAGSRWRDALHPGHGVMRCTLAGAWQRPQRELDRTVGGGAEAWADIFNVP
jgi:hypothetical protein